MTEVPYTPAMVIDLPAVERNLATLLNYANGHNLKVRPHTKTHKSIRIGRMQIAAGCSGLTVAKLGEALVMAEAGDDLFIAYPILDAYRREHLPALAKRRTVRVGIDSAYAAEVIGGAAKSAGATIGVLADIDVGHHRTGVQSPAELLKLAQVVDRTPGLRLDGIMCYPGHIKGPEALKAKEMPGIEAILVESLGLFKKAGLNTAIVSGGSSPTCMVSHLVPSYTEIRPGTNIYNDMNQFANECCTIEECAARIVCTVISDAVPGKFVLDAGSKTLTQDRAAFNPDAAGFGRVVEYPEGVIVRLSEEHAEVDASKCARRPKLGERVQVIPNHICPCVNLQDSVWFRQRGGELGEARVEGRGKLV